jgi:hypothetical protein
MKRYFLMEKMPMILRQEGIANANKINIWYETFGNKNHPAFLLIMGACCRGISHLS